MSRLLLHLLFAKTVKFFCKKVTHNKNLLKIIFFVHHLSGSSCSCCKVTEMKMSRKFSSSDISGRSRGSDECQRLCGNYLKAWCGHTTTPATSVTTTTPNTVITATIITRLYIPLYYSSKNLAVEFDKKIIVHNPVASIC